MTRSRPCRWLVGGAVFLACGLESLAQAHRAFDWREVRAGGYCGMRQDFKREHVYDFYNTLDSIGAYVRITKIANGFPNYDVEGASRVYSDIGPPAHDYYAVQLPVAKGHRIKVTERLTHLDLRLNGYSVYGWPKIRVSEPLPLCINGADAPIHPLLKETTGLSIPWNINDSDGDDIPDLNDEYVEGNDPELVKMQIRSPGGLPVEKIESDCGGTIVRLYERQTKKYGDSEDAIPARLGANLVNHTPYKGFDDDLIYVEGVSLGSAVLTLTGKGGITDRIKLNVVPKVDSVEILGAPSDGLVVENGEDVTFAAHILPSDFVPPTDEPKWYYQKLKSDGTWEAWTSFGANAYGTQYVHAATASGIFRVKTVLKIGGVACEKIYERTSDETYGPGQAGDPDAFGVADTAIQISIRSAAKGFLGSTAYPQYGVVDAQYGFPEYPYGTFKCNIFVAHRAVQAGAAVPAINGTPATYPPLANEWAGTEDTHPYIPGFQTDIDDWTLISSPTYPQPGFIVGHPHPTWEGHVGIVDYDGEGIGAGGSGTVNKNAEFLDGTSGFRKYEP